MTGFFEAVAMGACLTVDAWDYGQGERYELWTAAHERYLAWKMKAL